MSCSARLETLERRARASSEVSLTGREAVLGLLAQFNAIYLLDQEGPHRAVLVAVSKKNEELNFNRGMDGLTENRVRLPIDIVGPAPRLLAGPLQLGACDVGLLSP
jgi:hypothetical protein